MIRSEHVFAAALGLAMVATVCLGMLAFQCNGCALHALNVIAAGLIAAALLLGSVLLAVAVWSTRRLWRKCRPHIVSHPSTLQQVCRRLELPADQIICVDHPDIFVFCFGWLRPKIVVSAGLLKQVSSSELAAILAHERRHQQQRDPLRLLVMRILRWMLCPLPAMHDFYRSFVALLEIDADQAAMTASSRPALAGALYKLLTQSGSPHFGSPPAVLNPFSASYSRLEHLLDPHHTIQLPLSMPRLMISIFPFIALCVSMFAA